ncbi:hypothetical protein [Microbacterium sp.]|uniref:hypothetical protein n=1 Tax=Microbacterium sp. TaxID=51671 RepID=UPI0032423483
MSDTTTTDVTETTEGGEQKQEQTFTQADIDKIVRDRLAQQAKNKFGDYDDLKSQVEGAKTLEQQFSDMKNELAATKTQALRARIAADHGISTKKGPNGEPSDADLFLTGSDEATLEAQAKRLAEREADRKKNGNVARREGTTTNTEKASNNMRDFTRQLFGSED